MIYLIPTFIVTGSMAACLYMSFSAWMKEKRNGETIFRYRRACSEAAEMLRDIPDAASTAEWIEACGEDHKRIGIDYFHDWLKRRELNARQADKMP